MERIYGIPGEAGDGFGQDNVDAATQSKIDHPVEVFPVLGIGAGNTAIRKHFYKLPVRIAFDVAGVEIHLCLITGLLLVLFRRDPGVGGDPLFTGYG